MTPIPAAGTDILLPRMRAGEIIRPQGLHRAASTIGIPPGVWRLAGPALPHAGKSGCHTGNRCLRIRIGGMRFLQKRQTLVNRIWLRRAS
jgi:hypothetical protein